MKTMARPWLQEDPVVAPALVAALLDLAIQFGIVVVGLREQDALLALGIVPVATTEPRLRSGRPGGSSASHIPSSASRLRTVGCGCHCSGTMRSSHLSGRGS